MRHTPRMAEITHQADRADRKEAGHAGARQSAAADILETKGKACEPDTGQHKAAAVQRPAPGLLQIGDQHVDEHDAQHPDWDVDEKYPAPRGISDDEPADRRPHDRADQRRDADKRHRPHQIGFRHGSQQDEPPDRNHQRAAHTLQDTRGNQGRQRVGHATSDRPQGEHDNRRAEDPARPKPVGGPAADRDEYGKTQ